MVIYMYPKTSIRFSISATIMLIVSNGKSKYSVKGGMILDKESNRVC